MLSVSRFNGVVENAFEEKAPHKICAYIYELANEFNHFYHETKILSEQDEARKASYLALLDLVREVLETCIDKKQAIFLAAVGFCSSCGNGGCCVILTSRFFIRLDIRPEKSILYYSIEEPFGSIYIHVQKQNIGLTNTLT